MESSRFQLDLARREVVLGERRVGLTLMEAGILDVLLRQPGRNWSRVELIVVVAGQDSPTAARAIDVHVARLRRKLGLAGKQIETVRGQGYRFALRSDD